MESFDLESLSCFEAVWNRVQNEKSERESPSYELLVSVMDGVYARMCGSRQLAKLSCGEERTCLLLLAEQLRKRYGKLQLLYFLMTGELHFAENNLHFASYTPYNLRKLWQITVENADLLQKCKLHENVNFVGEMEQMEKEVQKERRLWEELIGRMLQ